MMFKVIAEAIRTYQHLFGNLLTLFQGNTEENSSETVHAH